MNSKKNGKNIIKNVVIRNKVKYSYKNSQSISNYILFINIDLYFFIKKLSLKINNFKISQWNY